MNQSTLIAANGTTLKTLNSAISNDIDPTTIVSVNDDDKDSACTAIATDSKGKALFACSGAAWHKFGTRVSGDFTRQWIVDNMPQLMRKVEHRELKTLVNGSEIIVPGIQSVVQIEPDGAETFLEATSVTDSRSILQPSDLLEIFEKLYQSAGGKLTSIGYLHGGAQFFASAKLGEGFNVLGDEHETFINCVDAYDGSHQLRLYGSNHRPVCQNTVASTWAGSRSKFLGEKHTSNMLTRVPAMVEQLTQHIASQKQQVQLLEDLTRIDVKPMEFFDKFLDEIYADNRPSPVPVNVRSVDMGLNIADLAKSRLNSSDESDIVKVAGEIKRVEKQKKTRNEILKGGGNRFSVGLMDLYQSPTCQFKRGSVYSAYQAATEYANHHLGYRKTKGGSTKQEVQMANLMPGNKADVMNDIAMDVATSYLVG